MNFNHPTLYLSLVMLLTVMFLIKALSRNSLNKNTSKNRYAYRLKSSLITDPEHDFFNLLMQTFGNQYRIFPQVHLSAIFDHHLKGQSWQGALSHIDRKSIDFLICDPAQLKPLIGIELDDASHNQSERMVRDQVVESIFTAAGLPLVRFANHGSFNHQEIVDQINQALSSRLS